MHSEQQQGLIRAGESRQQDISSDRVQPVLKPLFRQKALARAVGALGLVRANVDGFAPALAAWEGLDLRRYFLMTLTADEHRTSDMLDTVSVPTLITCGDKDVLSPPRHAHALHTQIAGSELRVLPDTTHYAIIEKPDVLAQAIESFLEKRLR